MRRNTIANYTRVIRISKWLRNGKGPIIGAIYSSYYRRCTQTVHLNSILKRKRTVPIPMSFRTPSFHKRNSLLVVISAGNCIAVNFIRLTVWLRARAEREIMSEFYGAYRNCAESHGPHRFNYLNAISREIRLALYEKRTHSAWISRHYLLLIDIFPCGAWMMRWEYLPVQSQCSACVKDAVAKKTIECDIMQIRSINRQRKLKKTEKNKIWLRYQRRSLNNFLLLYLN